MDAPVRADGPPGQRAYLERLRCDGGGKPTWERVRNIGIGVYGNIVDQYEVECPSSARTFDVFMDAYHPSYRERRPISGFTLSE